MGKSLNTVPIKESKTGSLFDKNLGKRIQKLLEEGPVSGRKFCLWATVACGRISPLGTRRAETRLASSEIWKLEKSAAGNKCIF
jgi:hypothetical protein